MPAIGDHASVSISYLDHSNELRAVGLPVGELTAISLAGFLTQFGDLQTAMDAVTLGTRARQAWGETSVISNTPPANANAQVESEVLVRCRGAVGEAPFSFRIPTVDYAAFNWDGDSAVLSGAGATAATVDLVDAIEALVKMPADDSEGVVVYAIEVVE